MNAKLPPTPLRVRMPNPTPALCVDQAEFVKCVETLRPAALQLRQHAEALRVAVGSPPIPGNDVIADSESLGRWCEGAISAIRAAGGVVLTEAGAQAAADTRAAPDSSQSLTQRALAAIADQQRTKPGCTPSPTERSAPARVVSSLTELALATKRGEHVVLRSSEIRKETLTDRCLQAIATRRTAMCLPV